MASSPTLPFGARALIRAEFPPEQSLDVRDIAGAGYNTKDVDINIENNALSGGQNVDILPDTSISKRYGHRLYGNFMGSTTGTLGLLAHEPPGGTAELLSVYDTSVMRYVAGTWTALTGVTMTTNKPADSAFFPLTAKTYIVNQQDAVVKYTSGASGDQTDAAFKKGKYICHYKNRLIVANVSGQSDFLWYTDLGVDTFSTNNYLRAVREVTGLEVLYDNLLTFTNKNVFVTKNFSFNGVAAGPESFLPLSTDFGAIYDRTIVRIKGLVYWLGQSQDGIVAVYATDGTNVAVVSDKISGDLFDVNPAQLASACAVAHGRYYRLSIPMSGSTTNNHEYLWDTINQFWLPPYTNGVGGFSCYTTFTISGQLWSFAGTQSNGQVYRLNTTDSYDEIAEESFTTVGAIDQAVDANPVKRAAQSFKMHNYTLQESVKINSVYLRIKKNAGTTTGLTVRIETDNAGLPSGVLADANATTTIAAITSTSYAYTLASFSTPFNLTGNTSYWIVLKHTTEGSGTSQYYWSGHVAGTYTQGSASTYANTTVSTTQTYSPDANPESTSVDGVIINYPNTYPGPGDTFSNIRSAAGTTTAIAYDSAVNATLTILPGTTASQWAAMSRVVILFDTSSLPNDAVITAASIGLYVSYKGDQLSQSVGITSANPTSNTALVAGDYGISHFGSTRFATDIASSGLTANAYNTFPLNASGISNISLTAISKFAVRLSCDIDNSAPTWGGAAQATQIPIYTSEGGASYKPILSVTYSSATGSAVWTSVAAQDQNFLVYDQGAIDGFADTKAFFLSPQGQEAHLRDLSVTAAASGNYNIQVGLNTGDYDDFHYQDMNLLSGTGSVIGSTFTIGSSTLGAASRTEERLRFPSARARTFKFRYRNRFPNQPFTVYSYRTKHAPINKLK